MKQLEGQAEVKPRHLKNLIAAALLDTDLASVDKEYIYKQFRQKYPHVVQPSKVMQVEERRGLWVTFGNLNQWFDGSKKCLVHLGFAEDKPIKVIDMFAGHDLPYPDLDSELF